jgi:hypothetical protein
MPQQPAPKHTPVERHYKRHTGATVKLLGATGCSSTVPETVGFAYTDPRTGGSGRERSGGPPRGPPARVRHRSAAVKTAVGAYNW